MDSAETLMVLVLKLGERASLKMYVAATSWFTA